MLWHYFFMKRAKTKKSKVTIVSSKEIACGPSCYLCWLFKLMLALFVLMIIFWLGFCFGSLSAQAPTSHMSFGVCTPSATDRGAAVSDFITALGNKKSDAFDKEFLLQMTLHDQDAVDMAKLVLDRTKREDLKKFAQHIIDTQGQEIEQLRAWQTAWFTR